MKLLSKNNLAAAFEILAIVLLFSHTYVPPQSTTAQEPTVASTLLDTSNLLPAAGFGAVRILENFTDISKK